MGEKLFVSIKDESVKMFESNFLNMFSKVSWITPLIVWVPVVIFCLYLAIFKYAIGFLFLIGFFLIGMAVWTLSEYILHRFVFHFKATSEIGKQIHFVTHGVHHDYPNDSKRLVMTPAFSIPLAVPFFALFYFAFGGEGYTYAAFAGIVTGYLCYDMLHYAIHHAKWTNPYFVSIKQHHMLHHFQDPENGFGVSSNIWDSVFGTVLKRNKTT